jgi:hypothetical protein
VAGIERSRGHVLLRCAPALRAEPQNVPIPRRTLTALDAYLEERTRPLPASRTGRRRAVERWWRRPAISSSARA